MVILPVHVHLAVSLVSCVLMAGHTILTAWQLCRSVLQLMTPTTAYPLWSVIPSKIRKMATFSTVFRTPWKNTWTDMSETYGQLLPIEAHSSCHIWRQTMFGRFCGDSLNKKIKNTSNHNSLPLDTSGTSVIMIFLALVCWDLRGVYQHTTIHVPDWWYSRWTSLLASLISHQHIDHSVMVTEVLVSAISQQWDSSYNDFLCQLKICFLTDCRAVHCDICF